MRKNCDGCAYDEDDLILLANCVGCAGRGSRPHYVPKGEGVPINWWIYYEQQKEQETNEG